MLQTKHGAHDITSIQQSGRSCLDIAKEHLEAIDDLDGRLNAITAKNDKVLQDAERLDQLPVDQRGPLHGVPIVIKDQIETEGLQTAFGSKRCAGYLPKRDATLVRKLREAGALIIAKSTMPDWAASWFSTSSLSGETKNPHDLSRDPGGSSSGSGAAVAAGMAVAGIGGDTGGSIRLPSSFCGLVGVRVTPGRISRDGMSGLVVMQDTPGPMAHSVEDAAKILDAIVGYDPADEYTSVNAIVPPPNFLQATQNPSMKGKRLGFLREVFGTDKGILNVMAETEKKLRDAGAELIEVSIPELDHLKIFTSIYTTISRHDIDSFLAARPELSHLNIKDMQAAGDYHKSLDLIESLVAAPEDPADDPTLGGKLLERQRFQRVVAGVFAREKLDAMIYPTCQLLPPKTKDLVDLKWPCLDYPTNTVIASQLLFPAASVPVGKTKDYAEGDDGPDLPVGLEILGLPLGEEKLLKVAAGVEAMQKPV